MTQMTTDLIKSSPDFVFQDDLLTQGVQEVLAWMASHGMPSFPGLSTNSPLFTALKRVTAELTVVLTGAKTLEDENDFADSLGLIKDLDVADHDGFVATYAAAIVQFDRDSDKGESIVDDCIDAEIVAYRLNQVGEFIDRQAAAFRSAQR